MSAFEKKKRRISNDIRNRRTENQLLENASVELLDLYNRLDNGIREISYEIKKHTSISEIIYSTTKNIVYLCVQSRKNRLKLYLRTTDDVMIDYKNLTSPTLSSHGNITRRLIISPLEEKIGKFSIDDLINLIHQSYKTTL